LAAFGSARKVAEPSVRAYHHQQVRKALDHDILQPAFIDAPDINAVETAGDGVEAGRVDDDVEFLLGIAGLDALGRDAFDRRLVYVDQSDVGPVVDLMVPGLQRHPPGA
jgi:hypothetical protein